MNDPGSKCRVCGEDELSPRSTALVHCERCGTIMRRDMPSEEAILRHYEKATTYDAWQQEQPIRQVLWARRLDVVKRFATGGRLLDVGTGDGNFAQLAREDFAVTSTEVSSGAIEAAERRGVHPLRGTVHDIDFAGATFDVVTLWHVLEHLPSPGAALIRLHDLLTDDGVLVVAVPNEIRHLPTRHLDDEVTNPVASDDEIHLFFWTPATLRKTLRIHGWDVIWLGVDDVHVVRTRWIDAKHRFNVLLARATGWHFDPAMIAVCHQA